MEKVKVDVRPSGKKLSVKVKQPKLKSKQSVTVDFEIIVPKQSNLQLSSNNGAIKVADIVGKIKSRTNNGAVTAERISGDTYLKTNNGAVTIKKANLRPGKAVTNNGRISCEQITGDIECSINNGKIDVSYAKTAPGVCNVSLTTNNGAIDFTAPPDFSAVVEAKTEIGSIQTDLPLTVKGRPL